jgi:polyisoprenoid-binding protein YceI
MLSFNVFAQEWNQNDEKTNVTFEIRNFGINVDGKFKEIKINTNFNSNQLSESYINAEIQVKSIVTGIESRDEHILEEDYFDEENYPVIQLASSSFEETENDEIIMFADLTIKGITNKIKVPISINEEENSINIYSSFSINRTNFNVNGGGFVLSKTVKIQVEFIGNK